MKRPGAVPRFDDIVFAYSRLEWQPISRQSKRPDELSLFENIFSNRARIENSRRRALAVLGASRFRL
ncbi:MAG: hypothetical protein WDN00_15775 [Limisphaerales bacterium]